jgi:hypothetical protein
MCALRTTTATESGALWSQHAGLAVVADGLQGPVGFSVAVLRPAEPDGLAPSFLLQPAGSPTLIPHRCMGSSSRCSLASYSTAWNGTACGSPQGSQLASPSALPSVHGPCLIWVTSHRMDGAVGLAGWSLATLPRCQSFEWMSVLQPFVDLPRSHLSWPLVRCAIRQLGLARISSNLFHVIVTRGWKLESSRPASVGNRGRLQFWGAGEG